jgi:hypothetical protein
VSLMTEAEGELYRDNGGTGPPKEPVWVYYVCWTLMAVVLVLGLWFALAAWPRGGC